MYKPVEDAPLAFGDWRSVNPQQDLVAVDRIIYDYEGEIWYLRYNPDQSWYWASSMSPDEIAVF